MPSFLPSLFPLSLPLSLPSFSPFLSFFYMKILSAWLYNCLIFLTECFLCCSWLAHSYQLTEVTGEDRLPRERKGGSQRIPLGKKSECKKRNGNLCDPTNTRVFQNTYMCSKGAWEAKRSHGLSSWQCWPRKKGYSVHISERSIFLNARRQDSQNFSFTSILQNFCCENELY